MTRVMHPATANAGFITREQEHTIPKILHIKRHSFFSTDRFFRFVITPENLTWTQENAFWNLILAASEVFLFASLECLQFVKQNVGNIDLSNFLRLRTLCLAVLVLAFSSRLICYSLMGRICERCPSSKEKRH